MTDNTTGKARRGSVVRATQDRLRQLAGDPATAEEIAGVTGLNEGSVAGALNRLIREANSGVVRVGHGRYAYKRPGHKEPQVPAGQLFELVGADVSGNAVIRDEKGQLWRASRI